MSGIRYDLDAEAHIRDAAISAGKDCLDSAGYYSHEAGALTGYLRSLAAKATNDSSLPSIRERIANTMTFDLHEASELIDAIRAGIERQYPDAIYHVGDPLFDAAQACYECADQDADEPEAA